ncbi:MAG: DMT family transporter [Burkholderiaceae bacterium]|nr:DMT family transporter [Burkholderiaceae bacterium]
MSLVGSYVALTKPLVAVLPVFLLAWLRFGIGGLAMLRWIRKPADEGVLSRRTRFLIFLESFLGNFLFTLCMITGVSMTTAVSAGVIMSAIPAVVAVLSWIFLKERIGARVWLAIACCAMGIGLLAWAKSPGAGVQGVELTDGLNASKVWLGNLLVFGAVLCEAAYAVIGKKLTAVLSPKRISAIINLWGLVLMTPFGLYAALRFDFTAVPWSMWLLLLFYGLAASVWTVWLWMTGLKTVQASRAGMFTVMLPISAALVGVLVLGETLDGLQLLAFAIALTGLLLATAPGKNKPRR